MKKRPMFFVLLLSFLFISCENLLSPKDSYNNGDGKTYTITGDINIEGALPKELFNENSANSVARTGFPTVPNFSDSELNLYVSATNADSSSTIEGTINAEKTQYSINLPKGQWTITVSGEKSDVVILEGSVTVVLNDEYPVTNSEIIILKPIKTTGGKGNLKLALSIGSFNCGGVKATLSSSEDPKTKYILFTDSEGNPTSEIDLEFSDISSGTYSFDLVFYDRMNFDDAASDYVCENIIYILNDTVNIFDGLTTNEWSGTGYSEDKFTLTQEMITSFAMTTFYVDADYGNDDNEGTFFAPIKSINKVLEKIDTINDGSSEYRIYIKGNINNTSENSSFINDSFINITPTNTLNLLICSFGNEKSTINAERDESQTGRVMYIGENANVTLQNLILTGGYLTNDNGAGLYILNNNANVKIENSEISGNVIDNGCGAGLCVGYHLVGESLNLTIENSKISRNTIKHDSNGALSQAGSGIDIENVAVILTITNSEISENVIDQNNCSSVEFNDYGVGLCLGNRATTIISGTAIKNNKIKNAASTNENAGGGVYLDGGTLTIQNSTENNTVISGNSSTIGGGVAVTTADSASTTGSFFMSGGTISENIVTSSDGSGGNGSAVAVLTGGLFTVSENITINGDVYLYENQTITVSNNFEGGEVMITPFDYSADVLVLKPITEEPLTPEIVRKFEVTPQVLSGGYEYWYVTADGNLAEDSIIYVDSNFSGISNGMKNSPFITIQEAVNEAIRDNTAGSKKFKILLQSDVEDPSTVSYDPANNSSFVNIDPTNDLTLEIASYGEDRFTINANKSGENSGRVMYIGRKANVTLRNVKIKGGNLANGNGGAIYCSGTLNLVNSTISESNAKNGGGIYIENGTFTMNGGIIGNEILEDEDTKYSWEYAATTTGGSYSNFASSAGGGIYAENATVNIISGKVSYNYAINYESAGSNFGFGGGIFMKNGTLTIGEGAEVSYNSGYQGAGIRCESETLGEGTCTIKEGAIIKGNATHIYNQTNYGGGIFVKNSNFIMEGGTIEENYAGDGGAGIHLENVSPTITKGNIRNNKYGTEADAHKFGSEILLYDNAKLSISSSNVVIESLEDETRGIYVRNSGSQSELALSDSAYIKSPVYLDANANIKITGALTTPEEANGIITTITPNEYSTTRQVLVAGGGVTLSNRLVKQFNVTPAEVDKEWFVDSYGYLGKVPKIEMNDEGTAIYLMESYDNLLYIAQELRTNGINNFNIKLTNDIEIPSGKWTSPLDVTKASTIDGQGHSIKFNGGSGLFERFHGGSIENLVVEGTINTSSYKNHHNGQCGVGVLAGSTYKTTIKNVVSTVDVVDTGNGYVGGLIGYFGGNSDMDQYQPGSFIQNCAVYANITSTNGTVGGLVGGTWSGTQCWQINNCIYAGNVTGGTDQGVGAIIGTHNTGRKSTFKDTWYCANGTSEIVGKYNNQRNGVNFNGYDTVISKTPADIATEAAATLLNTNSDGTVNDVWEYIHGSDYPTLKQNW